MRDETGDERAARRARPRRRLVLVYVAGPYRAPTKVGVAANKQRARELADAVNRLGYGAFAVTPHLLGDGIEDSGDEELWLEGTLEVMRFCRAVVLVEPWEGSSGTRGEVEEAGVLGIPVFRGARKLEELARYLRLLVAAPSRPLPRYDEVYARGAAWLDGDARGADAAPSAGEASQGGQVQRGVRATGDLVVVRCTGTFSWEALETGAAEVSGRTPIPEDVARRLGGYVLASDGGVTLAERLVFTLSSAGEASRRVEVVVADAGDLKLLSAAVADAALEARVGVRETALRHAGPARVESVDVYVTVEVHAPCDRVGGCLKLTCGSRSKCVCDPGGAR